MGNFLKTRIPFKINPTVHNRLIAIVQLTENINQTKNKNTMKIKTRLIELPKENAVYLEDLSENDNVFLMFNGRFLQNYSSLSFGRLGVILRDFEKRNPEDKFHYLTQNENNEFVPLLLKKEKINYNPEKPLLIIKNGVSMGFLEFDNRFFALIRNREPISNSHLIPLIKTLNKQGYEIHEQI